MSEEKLSFASTAYLRAKSVWRGMPLATRDRRGTSRGSGTPFGKGRDPKALGDVLAATTSDLGWDISLDQARIVSEWADFVGLATAEHTEVIGFRNGVLEVACDSTTWTTELRRLRGEMLSRLLAEYPAAGISDLRFLGPGAPSWQHGRLRVPGRGPRDTYG